MSCKTSKKCSDSGSQGFSLKMLSVASENCNTVTALGSVDCEIFSGSGVPVNSLILLPKYRQKNEYLRTPKQSCLVYFQVLLFTFKMDVILITQLGTSFQLCDVCSRMMVYFNLDKAGERPATWGSKQGLPSLSGLHASLHCILLPQTASQMTVEILIIL